MLRLTSPILRRITCSAFSCSVRAASAAAGGHLHHHRPARAVRGRIGCIRPVPHVARQDPHDATARSGAEVRERFSVEDVVVSDGTVVGVRDHGPSGESVVEKARVVIGADGRNSRVAWAVHAQHTRTSHARARYTFWSGLPIDAFTIGVRDDRAFPTIRTNDDLSCCSSPARPRTSRHSKPPSRAATSPPSIGHPSSPSASARQPARSGSSAAASPTSSVPHTDRAGHSSAMPATPKTRSRRRASPTPSATPNGACCPGRGVEWPEHVRRRDVGLPEEPGHPRAAYVRIHRRPRVSSLPRRRWDRYSPQSRPISMPRRVP